MNHSQMRLRAPVIAIIFFILGVAGQQTAEAKDAWTRVQSKNFTW
jgi:hypothetical protein